MNVSEENFEKLYDALEKYISEHYTEEDFTPTVYINGTLRGGYSQKFAKELELLEPYGVGNKRPIFELEEASVPVRLVKPQSPHISLKSNKIDLMFFGGLKYKKIIESAIPKKFIFEYNISTFRGKEYVKGFVRDVIYNSGASEFASDEIAISGIEALTKLNSGGFKQVDKAEVEALMSKKGVGTLYIAWDPATLSDYEGAKNFNADLFIPSAKNFSDAVLVAPDKDMDFGGYKRIIYLDGLAGMANSGTEIVKGAPLPSYIIRLSCDRELLLKVFAEVSARSGVSDGCTAEETAINNEWSYEKPFVYFALKVFEELGIVSYANGKLEIMRGVKSKLENSALYNTVRGLKGE